MKNHYYISSVLMEKNRWTPEKIPTFQVSEWGSPFQTAGFAGIELWANHALKAESAEVERLSQIDPPVTVFNSYVGFDKGCEGEQDAVAEMAHRLGATGIKYNVGKEADKKDIYLEQLRNWRARLPKDVQLICECHPGTIIEESEAARSFFDEAQLSNHAIIVHPFNQSEASLQNWFDRFGSEIQLAHLQMRDEHTVVQGFDFNRPLVERAVAQMKRNNFAGAFSFEFTTGIRHPEQSPELLFDNAKKDLILFREIWESA